MITPDVSVPVAFVWRFGDVSTCSATDADCKLSAFASTGADVHLAASVGNVLLVAGPRTLLNALDRVSMALHSRLCCAVLEIVLEDAAGNSVIGCRCDD